MGISGARGHLKFCLKSRFLREILKKARNPNFRENHMGRPRQINDFSQKDNRKKNGLVARPDVSWFSAAKNLSSSTMKGK